MRTVKTVLRHGVGWSLMLVGLAGLLLPLLPGWIFIGAAATVLAPDVPFFARRLRWFHGRFPSLQRLHARLHGHPVPAEGVGAPVSEQSLPPDSATAPAVAEPPAADATGSDPALEAEPVVEDRAA